MLDDRTLAYADFRGNRQYISVGNVGGDDRVSLILMDYASRRRLKIWAQARVVDASEDLQLIASLKSIDYPAQIERAVILSIESFDWNCPQHITPRFTEEELFDVIEPLNSRVGQLEEAVAAPNKMKTSRVPE